VRPIKGANMAAKPIREKWPGSMTDRERFVRQMHHQPVDRCFNMEFGYWQENFSQWSIFRENGLLAEVPKDDHATIPH
jgi:hypothetical protein